MTTNANRLNLLDDSIVEGTGIESKRRFPYAQIHNAKDNRGADGGLFIQTADNLPTDTVFELDEEDNPIFRSKTITFDDGSGGDSSQEGVLSPFYHLSIIACSANANGNPTTYKDQNGKITFTVLCVIKEAKSLSAPLKINYRGVSAIRMRQHVHNFDNLVLGTANQLRRRPNGGNADAKALARFQMWCPVRHDREQLGQGKNISWACPVQDLIKSTVRESRPDDGKYTRTGVSILREFASFSIEEEATWKVAELSVNDADLLKTLMKWAVEFKDELKGEATSNQTNGGWSNSMPHFADTNEQLASPSAINLILRLAEERDTDWFKELMYLEALGSIRNAPEDYQSQDPNHLISMLSKAGAHIIIESLKSKEPVTKAAAVGEKTVAKSHAGGATYSGNWSKFTSEDDDEVPF